MSRIIVTAYVSLDGVVEGPGGFEDYRHLGWTFEFEMTEARERFKEEETLESEALLLGRVTYDIFAASWPDFTGKVADKVNSMPKYVVSSTLTDPEWHNTTVLTGPLPDIASQLRDSVDGDIVVHGSPTLVQGLLEHDLVDELRLMVFPVVLGTGKRLFGETSDKKRFTLSKLFEVGDGVSVQTFHPTTTDLSDADG